MNCVLCTVKIGLMRLVTKCELNWEGGGLNTRTTCEMLPKRFSDYFLKKQPLPISDQKSEKFDLSQN